MKKPVADMHMHTLVSGHAYGDRKSTRLNSSHIH